MRTRDFDVSPAVTVCAGRASGRLMLVEVMYISGWERSARRAHSRSVAAAAVGAGLDNLRAAAVLLWPAVDKLVRIVLTGHGSSVCGGQVWS